MNHRLGMRKPVSMEVMLEEFSLGVVRGVAEDVGFGGIFVRTGPAHFFPNTMVVVLLNGMGGLGVNYQPPRLPARVVWSNGHGAGLVFTKYSNDGIAALRRLLLMPAADEAESPPIGQDDISRIWLTG